jgi:hypothetical protein
VHTAALPVVPTAANRAPIDPRIYNTAHDHQDGPDRQNRDLGYEADDEQTNRE